MEQDKTKHPGGRPTVMTPEVISKLEEVFAIGGSDKEACFYADISHQALYDYQNKHPEFTERKEALKERPILLARQTVVKKIGESYQNAIDYLKRKKRSEFGDNTDITSGGEKLPTPIMPLSNAIPTDDSNKEDNPAI